MILYQDEYFRQSPPHIDYFEHKSMRNINKIINRPDVKEHILEIPMESEFQIYPERLKNPDLIVYEIFSNSKLSGLALIHKEGKLGKIDYTFLPPLRGKIAKNISESILNEINIKYNISVFYGKIKVHNKSSLIFSKWLGFKEIQRTDTYITVARTWYG